MPLIPKEKCETLTMDFDSLMAEKSGLGTAGIVVINKDQDIIKCMARIASFINMRVVVNAHHVERDQVGCGECLRMAKGEASKDEVEMLEDVTKQIEGHTICASEKDPRGQFKVY